MNCLFLPLFSGANSQHTVSTAGEEGHVPGPREMALLETSGFLSSRQWAASERISRYEHHIWGKWPRGHFQNFYWSIGAYNLVLVSAVWKVDQLCIYIYPLFFRFPPHLGPHKALSRVPCGTQQVLISYLVFQ